MRRAADMWNGLPQPTKNAWKQHAATQFTDAINAINAAHVEAAAVTTAAHDAVSAVTASLAELQLHAVGAA